MNLSRLSFKVKLAYDVKVNWAMVCKREFTTALAGVEDNIVQTGACEDVHIETSRCLQFCSNSKKMGIIVTSHTSRR